LLGLGIAAASAFAIGFGTVLLFCPGIGSPRLLAVKLFLGVGLGLGVTAGLAFVFLLAHGRPDTSYPFYELFVLLVLIGLLVRRKSGSSPPAVRAEGGARIGSTRLEWILAGAFCLAAAAALAAVLILLYRAPYGHWDAWAIYNLRARSIYRGGYEWREAFSPLVSWSHPDYPPLLPLAVVRGWMYTGVETTVVPRLIAGLFTAATIGLVAAVVALLRGPAQACIAGVVLLGNVFLVEHASSQYADLPVMFFCTAAVSLLVLQRELRYDEGGGRLVLAGLAAGLAAWSKNEGLMFIAVMLIAHFAVVFRGSSLREYSSELRLLVSGLLPVMLLVAYFKLALAPPGDLATLASEQPLVPKLLDPDRYLLIAREIAKFIVPQNLYGSGLAFALLLWAWCAGLGAVRRTGAALGGSIVLILFMGYVAVYVVTPYALAWHLSTSIDRVLLQLWPMFVLVFFLIVATPEEVLRRGTRSERGSAQGDA